VKINTASKERMSLIWIFVANNTKIVYNLTSSKIGHFDASFKVRSKFTVVLKKIQEVIIWKLWITMKEIMAFLIDFLINKTTRVYKFLSPKIVQLFFQASQNLSVAMKKVRELIRQTINFIWICFKRALTFAVLVVKMKLTSYVANEATSQDPATEEFQSTENIGKKENVTKKMLAERMKNFVVKTDLFYHACYHGHVELVKQMLIHYKTDFQTSHCEENSGFTAFHLACAGGHTAIVEILLKEYDSCNFIKNRDGVTGLEVAVQFSQIAISNSILDSISRQDMR
jgi:hypothetical protein